MLTVLEWLAKYGFIDIIFGVGIFTYLVRVLRKRTTDHIDGVDVLPSLVGGNLSIEVRNNSRDTLYVFRAYLKPGYRFVFFFGMAYRWESDRFQCFSASEPKNTAGSYVLKPVREDGGELRPPLAEPKHSVYYRIPLDSPNPQLGRDALDAMTDHCVGRLILHAVHGTNPKVLEVQI